MKKSKLWPKMVDILNECFPKGKCQERSKAILMIALIEIAIREYEYEKKHLSSL